MKTPKPRIRALYPFSMSAVIYKFGWKARNNTAIVPDYFSKSGRIRRFKEMPDEAAVEAAVLYCLSKPAGRGWNEIRVCGLGKLPKSESPCVTGTKAEMEALCRRFIIKNASVKLKQEVKWLNAELEAMRKEVK